MNASSINRDLEACRNAANADDAFRYWLRLRPITPPSPVADITRQIEEHEAAIVELREQLAGAKP